MTRRIAVWGGIKGVGPGRGESVLTRMLLSALSAVALLVPSALGAVVWDGRFNDYR